VFPDPRVLDQQLHGREREHFAVSRFQQAAHVLAADLEATAGDAALGRFELRRATTNTGLFSPIEPISA